MADEPEPDKDETTAPETGPPAEVEPIASEPGASEAEVEALPEPGPGPGPEPEPEPELEPQPQPNPARKPPASPPPKRPVKPRGFWRLVRKLFVWGVILGIVAPIALVLVFRVVPPPGTILMAQKAAAGRGWDYRWRPLSKISPAMVQAAIAAEDARFCEHHGFDFEAIEKAMKNNARRPGRIRGGSTISQQTAKNVFLWPQRDWVRKGLETYFTGLIEVFWGKKRIMEVYLNVAEMGPGVYGAEAAARHYFKTDAKHLTRQQASRLAAILPNPIKYKAVAPGPYVQRRSRRIGGAMGTVREEGMAACVLR